MADSFMNNRKCIEIMYKMHQCAVCSVYCVLRESQTLFSERPKPLFWSNIKTDHHNGQYFHADTVHCKTFAVYLMKGPKINDAAKYEISL